MLFNTFLLIPKFRLFRNWARRSLSEQAGMRVLNVAEKNDAAKNIAAYLSGGTATRREGLSKFNKIYEFESEMFGQNCRMVMTSVAGHLLSYEFVGVYRSWKGANPVTLFEAPIEKICPTEYENIKKTLQREIRTCSKLIIWTDCDREGEGIGFEIIEVCKAVKGNIGIYRAKFSEITQESVKRALRNLEAPNKHISDAVDVRQELDLRIGAAFTRFQTLHLKKAFPNALSDNLVSYGSCQFPTLGFVVERFKAISEFIPEKFWQINVKHTKNDLTVNFSWKRNRLFDKLACEVLYDKCIKSNTAVVENVLSKPKIKWRPRPLDTVELEKLASRKLRINAKETMKIAEKLYTQGLISYPRTETNIFPKELNLVPLIEHQTEDASWGEFAQKVLRNGPNPFQGNKSDQAHPPIHPIKYTNELCGNEEKIYQFIVRHFLACLSKHAEGLETEVDIDIAKEKFLGKGLMITAKNYLEVYPYDKWSDKEIHIYRKGDNFVPEISMGEGETTPPELLTEADLIALMEKHGIGTDATHADHIETIKARLYVGLQNDKYFVPRTLGMGLVEGYTNMGYAMAKPELRAELEADLKRICENQKSPQEVLARHIKKYKEVFEGVQREVNRLSETIQNFIQVEATPVESEMVFEMSSGIVCKCLACNCNMILRTKKDNGKFVSCSAYPRCREVFWFPSFVQDATVTSDTCPTCGPNTHLIKFKFERGSCYLPVNYVGCVGGCDVNLLEILNCNRRTIRGTESANSVSQLADLTNTMGGFNEVNDSGFGSFNESSPRRVIPAESSPNCHCGVPAVRLTVKKSGPNCGRVFYKCDAPRDSPQCDFFQWEGEESRSQRKNRGRINQTVTLNNRQEEEEQLRCYCAIPCRRLTVQKGGPNKGRRFYACGKSVNESDRCNFFKWAENDDSTSNNSNTSLGNVQFYNERNERGGSKSSSRKNGSQTKKRKCGICGQEGHNRKNCPQR